MKFITVTAMYVDRPHFSTSVLDLQRIDARSLNAMLHSISFHSRPIHCDFTQRFSDPSKSCQLLELAIRNHSKRAAVALLLTVATLTPSVLLRPLARVTRSRALLSGMAWRSSGASNEELVSNLHRNGVIESQQVRQAMLGVSLDSLVIRR